MPVSADSRLRASAWLTRMWSISSRAAVEDAAEGAALGEHRRDVPQALGVALVGRVEAGGLELRAGRAEQDLRRGGERLVVEVAEHDDGPALLQQRGGVVAQRDRLGGAQGERVAGVARALVLVARLEAPGERQELGLQVRGDQVDPGDAHAQRAAAHLRRGRPVVLEADRVGPGGEGADALDVLERQLGEEADADAAVVGVGGEPGLPLALQARSAGPRTPARHPPPGPRGRRARSARSSPPATASFLS